MCEFCLQHGEGQKWYLQAKNYSEDLLSDIRRQKMIKSFAADGEASAQSIEKLNKLPNAPKFIQALVRRLIPRKMKKRHYGQVVPIEENSFLPDLKAIPESALKRARLMFINYPNNPTSAVAPKGFFEEVISLAVKHNIIVCHDAAYSEIYFDGKRPQSFMEIEGAKSVGIEFHSLSKTYNMTGWRIGFAVGNKEVLAGLGKIKSNLDSGVFQAVQEAGIVALATDDKLLSGIRNTYQERRDVLYEGLKAIGIELTKPMASFYLWAKVPRAFDSSGFAAHMLEKAGVLATPGNGFGAPGEGYVRFALTVPVGRIQEAVARIRKII